jgi:hypothetical protein
MKNSKDCGRTADRPALTLIGEEISGAWNAEALADIAEAFGGDYLPYAASKAAEPGDTLSGFDCLLAAENHPSAQNIYSFRPPSAGKCALFVGNEARGLRRQTLQRAHAILEIPLLSKNINCLNVAAAAAVMLFYLHLSEPLALPKRTLSSVQKRRPDLLFIGGPDPMELGSAIRSACAFGWERIFLQDRGNAWYECDRRIRSEGRGAARRGRNPIKVIPYQDRLLADYRQIIVCTREPCGKPFAALPLTGGDTLIVLEDEQSASDPWTPPGGSTAQIRYATLPDVPLARYHYRQMASIALAEIARQLGWTDFGRNLSARQKTALWQGRRSRRDGRCPHSG